MPVTVLVNGGARTVSERATVADLVASFGRGPAGIAVAVNGEVVPRSRWADRTLQGDDRIEVLTAAQGG